MWTVFFITWSSTCFVMTLHSAIISLLFILIFTKFILHKMFLFLVTFAYS